MTVSIEIKKMKCSRCGREFEGNINTLAQFRNICGDCITEKEKYEILHTQGVCVLSQTPKLSKLIISWERSVSYG